METPRRRSGLGRRDDGDELRKSVLKRNHLKRVVFDQREKQKIRLKRIVSLDRETVSIFTTVTVYESRLTEAEFEEMHTTQEMMKLSGVKEEKNPMERIEQAAYYSAKMVRLTRDVFLDRKFLDQEWMTRSKRDFVKGFPTSDGAFGSIRASSEGTSTEFNGYRSTTSLQFAFNGSLQESRLVATPRPNLGREHSIHLERRVEKFGSNLELLLDTRLLPNLYKLDSGWVEETCEYLLAPSKRELTELGVTYKQSPGFQHTPAGTVIFWSDSLNNSVYSTPNASHESPEIARQNPNGSLNETGPYWGKAPAQLFYDLLPDEKVTADRKISVHVCDQDEPSMQMEVQEPGGRKHSLTLTADIDGKSQEFVASLGYNGPKEFLPKRVVVDGRCIWQQSNDWKPNWPVKKTEIDMKLRDKK